MTAIPAAFIDRDGTIMRDVNYVRDPNDVTLLPGAAGAVRRLNDHGIPVVVVTNQSGIARNLISPGDYELVRLRLESLLAAEGARVDATYMCPHHPDITGTCDCRKPGVGLYREAIAQHGFDATRSLFTGDHWRDVEPAAAFGGMGILLDVETTLAADLVLATRAGAPVAASLAEAVDRFLATLPALDRRQ